MTEADDRAESETLSRALASTSRKAVASGLPTPNPLDDPALLTLARSALSAALGPPRLGPEPFPATVWTHGATHVGKTSPGVKFTGTFNGFASLLRQRAKVVTPKRTGWVVEPTSNIDGRRTNASTTHMHAVFLDCDDCGSWDQTLAALADIGLAHVAYQSSGYTPEKPKWRVVLPLTAPFPVTSDAGRAAWKKVYHRVRALVGALGGLTAEGFDSRTDAPSAPWFLTERPTEASPPREVVLRPGASLDATALALALPAVPEETAPARRTAPTSSAEGDREQRSDDEIDLIVSSLAAASSAVPRGRRDLYLALPGALLDRGLHPDDVLAICTEVSLAYPRRHEDKHRDNVHGAKTTIAKWAAGDKTYTRIGTLQATFPNVAEVLDRLVPDPVEEGLRQSMSDGAAIREAPENSVEIPTATTTPPPAPKASRAKTSLRKRLERLAADRADLPGKKGIAGAVLRRVLQSGGFSGYLDVRIREAAVAEVFNLVGFEETTSTFDALVEVIGEISPDDYRTGATALAKARARREAWNAAAPEREAKRQAEAHRHRLSVAAEIAAVARGR